MSNENPRVVVLVPIRYGDPQRDRLWAHCKPLWEQRHGWSIYEGVHEAHEGPFNRSAGVNRAAALADTDGPWDVGVIIDNDVIGAPDSVQSAVDIALQTNKLVIAHDERIMMNKNGTDQILKGFQGSWRGRSLIETVYQDSVSCIVAVSRKLWELAGPMDELFVGWGREDTAFHIACESETGPILKVHGETFHLCHPLAAETKATNPLRVANEARHQAYVAARGNRDIIRALRAEMSTVPLPETTIPRIIHRTVPAKTSEQIEEWWSEVEKLHPGWDCRTYREPVDPKDWPLTGDLFKRCENGAQKAGLIRLEALYTHGGIYLDSDVICFRSLEPLLRCEAFAGWEDENVVPDAVLGARPEHPAFKTMLDKARASVIAREGAWKSGPGVTTSTLQRRDDVLLLPPGSLYPFHYLEMEEGPAVNASPPPWAFVAHQWHHSWGTPAQKAALAAKQR